MAMFLKGLFGDIKTNIIRFLSITFIVMLGTMFYAGLTSAADYMRDLANGYLNQSRFYDVEINGRTGLDYQSASGIAESLARDNAMANSFIYIQATAEMRTEIDGIAYLLRAMSLPESEQLNTVLGSGGESVTPLQKGQVYVDAVLARAVGIAAGQELNFYGNQYTIAAVVDSSYYISIERGISSEGLGFDGFIYFSMEDISDMPHFYTVFVRQMAEKNYLSSGYNAFSQNLSEQVNTILGNAEMLRISTAADNVGMISFRDDSDRIQAIAVVFPVLFFLVAALVSQTNMTRLVDSHRTQIGLRRALGKSGFSIVFSYFLFAAIATLLGALPGYFAGINLLPRLIIDAYSAMYSLPPISTPPGLRIALLSTGFILISTTVPTLIIAAGAVRIQPAALLRPKSPPAGKRVLIERINWLWNRLKFMQKVAVRNLFRYKTRGLLMLVGIIGATSLLVVAYGLRNSVGAVADKQFEKVLKYDYVVQGMPEESIYTQLDDSGIAKGYAAVSMQGVEIKGTSTQNIFLVVPENVATFSNFFGLYQYKTGESLALQPGQGIITRQLARHLGVAAGDKVTLIADGQEFTVKIADVAENYLSHYVFLHSDDYPQAQSNTVLVTLDDAASGNEVTKLSQTLLQNPYVMYVTNLKEDGQKVFENTVNTLSLVILAINLFAMALSFVVMFSLTNIGIEERRRELATLKVLGFTNGQAAMYMYRESAIMTIIASVLGCFTGYLLLGYIYTTVETMAFMFVRSFFITSYLFPLLLMFAFYIVVNLIMFFRIARIDMVSALKATE